MLVDLIEVKTNEKEALKNFLKKIPLLSKVIQFNRGINDINLKYIEYKILKYKIKGQLENQCKKYEDEKLVLDEILSIYKPFWTCKYNGKKIFLDA